MLKVAIASDHAGYEFKNKLINKLSDKIIFTDLGTYSNDSVDYPDFGIKLGKEITTNKYDFGIAICGTGIGINISTNKVRGIRSALIYNKDTARLAKQHNNANIICFGARQTKLSSAVKMVNIFINTNFENRHQKRLDKIKKYEDGKN